ncbi:hypothetical protein LPJ75_006667 [Coemansia sp. RSA 2598]|nr:hypothetical protein LPJ75_006667 [Coemansia sp. RSA 2598]
MASLDNTDSQVYSSVQDYYGKVLESSSDLKTNACTAGTKPTPYLCKIISAIPKAVNDKFYGCGNPIPLGIQGLDLLDLGSGSGRDCYLAASLVGPKGSVTGVDMTDEQLQTARGNIDEYAQTLGYQPNMRFLTGYIEDLKQTGVPDSSVDICISNCVVNMSPDKRSVFKGVYSALRQGGEFHFSDMYADKRVSDEARKHKVLINEGMGGSLYVEDFEQMVREIGFVQPRVLAISHIKVYDQQLQSMVGDTKFYSITYRLFKLPKDSGELEEEKKRQEVLAQSAVYNGLIDGQPDQYVLDIDNTFRRDVPCAVDADTLAILRNSWLRKYFAFVPAQDSAGAGGSEWTSESAKPSTVELMRETYEKSQKGCCDSTQQSCL